MHTSVADHYTAKYVPTLHTSTAINFLLHVQYHFVAESLGRITIGLTTFCRSATLHPTFLMLFIACLY